MMKYYKNLPFIKKKIDRPQETFLPTLCAYGEIGG